MTNYVHHIAQARPPRAWPAPVAGLLIELRDVIEAQGAGQSLRPEWDRSARNFLRTAGMPLQQSAETMKPREIAQAVIEIYQRCLDPAPADQQPSAVAWTFEAQEQPHDATTPLRSTWHEEDLQALVEQPKFLVAVDAHRTSHRALLLINTRAFGEASVIPRRLDPIAFRDLVAEIIRRINAGELSVPSEWRTRYASFYAPNRKQRDTHD